MRYMRIQLILEAHTPALEAVPTEEHSTGEGMRGDRRCEFKRMDEEKRLAVATFDFDYNI